MSLPDWQLPPGVDRGLWDYLHAGEMVAGYDAQMAASPLAAADVAFCERWFEAPGRLLDLGCGTGRLCLHFAAKGHECVGVDLSGEMLATARANAAADGVAVEWVRANLLELDNLPAGSFDSAACLFSTLGMVRGADNRAKVVATASRLLRPGGRFALHVHNRYFARLGLARTVGQWWRTQLGGPDAGDITMSQAYGGAPLTLHHFTRRGAIGLLTAAGFAVREVLPVGTDGRRAWPTPRVYGWLLLGERPVTG